MTTTAPNLSSVMSELGKEVNNAIKVQTDEVHFSARELGESYAKNPSGNHQAALNTYNKAKAVLEGMEKLTKVLNDFRRENNYL